MNFYSVIIASCVALVAAIPAIPPIPTTSLSVEIPLTTTLPVGLPLPTTLPVPIPLPTPAIPSYSQLNKFCHSAGPTAPAPTAVEVRRARDFSKSGFNSA
ncbi:hypothetical protein EYC84_009467 [Monilinia fructicola]|uniref:Uncharacterized protein n=1 Tax=Monilinia fructicola TaxID=38448 RepID=A0A5M9JEL4_MONFR|nr:hypothetical protein EYC84_009467 [Monilinia fructicola]